VIHLAAYFDLSGEPNPKYQTVTIDGTERLLHAFQAFELEQFVFASTMLVHAPGEHGKPIDEDWPLDLKLPYRESKILAERLICEHRGSIPVVLARPAGVYDDLCHSAFLAHQIARIYERRLISHLYSGRLDTGQSWLHLDDLTEALLRIVMRRKALPPELPLLLGESEVMGYGDIQREAGELIHGEAWRTVEISRPVARAGAWIENEILQEDPFIKPWMVDASEAHYELDTSRAQELLDWKPQHCLRATLPKMVEALKRDPAAWYRTNELNAAKVAAEGVEMKAVEHESKDPVHEHMMMREHMQGMRKMHLDMLWVHYLNLLLGAWLATSPFIFGSFSQDTFSEAVWRVTEERGLWEPELRSALLAWSDVISGLLIMSF
jgi:nucleoside-diphosphate-sugar epimerase